MKETRILMDMPITVEVVDATVTKKDINDVFDYFSYIDDTFSPFKRTSEISQINYRQLPRHRWSRDMQTVFRLSVKTKRETNGYFDIFHNGKYDQSGLVKGWAVNNAAKMLEKRGFKNYYIDAGGDIQIAGKNHVGENWRIGIRNPFNRNENVKILSLTDKGVATSGTYIRGQHIYDPHRPEKPLTDIVSLTVIGPNVYDADRFVTAAFAMGKKGIGFIAKLNGFAGYMIDSKGMATYTEGFQQYEIN